MFEFNLFGRKSVNPFVGFTDFHSHILPGVDDGVAEMDDSLAILDDYEHRGFKEVWLTPHIMEEVPNRPDDLRKRFDELCAAYDGGLKLHLAAENMIDNLFLERLDNDEILTIGEGRDMILVETSFFQPPIDLDNAFERIRAKGLTALFAHPERYQYLNSIEDYRRLARMGIRLQLNLFSLVGQYGPVVKRKAEGLLKEGLYSCAGTDIHRPRQVRQLELNKYGSRVRRGLSALQSGLF